MSVGSKDGFEELELTEVVDNDLMNFEAWTALISTAELKYNDDIDKIGLVYDSFLSEFPLCYGYWKKYAEHHTRLSNVENVIQIFERAVEAGPYSVGVWVDYCSFSISSFEDSSEICRLFERGLSFVGKDYLCYLLWDKYIEFEYSQQHWDSLAEIYIKTLKFPTKKLQHYYESFKKLVSIWEEETGIQKGSHAGLQSKLDPIDETMILGDAEISHVISDLLDPSTRLEALQKYLLIGEFFYQKACDLDTKVRKFEKNIHRPYFHVKPLDDSQLQNWHHYLDFIENEGDFDWAVKLYERCLISCAHYPEFWMRYVDFVEPKGGKEIAIDAMDRATNVFLKDSPQIHLFNAWYKEKNGDTDGSYAAVSQCDQEVGSHFIDMVQRKANMEKRMGNYDKASHIYTEALDLAAAKRPDTLPMLYVHYARHQCTITNDVEAAREVLIKGIQCAPHSELLLKELLCFSLMHGGTMQVHLLDSRIAQALTCESNVSYALSTKDRENISTLYLEFIDSCGSIHDIRRAWNRHLKLFPHLVRVKSSLKKSAKAGDVLKILAEGRPDFFDLEPQKASVDQPPNLNGKIQAAENLDKNERQHGDDGLDSVVIEHTEASKTQITNEEAIEAQQEKSTSKDGLLLNPQDEKSTYFKTPAVDGSQRSSPRKGEDIKESSPISSPNPSLDREGARFRPNSSSKGRSEYGPREYSEDRGEKSLSPRRRGSHGYSDSRYHRQRSHSPRKHNSRWNSDNRWHRERNQRRYSRYPNSRGPDYSCGPDNSRGRSDGRTQNQSIVIVGNKGQSHNAQHQQVVGSTPLDQLPVQYPQSQINQYPPPNTNNEEQQYAGAQNVQLYNQMWQYYYQQQQLLMSQQPQPQSPSQQQQMPNLQEIPGQTVPNQQQLLQLQYQRQQLYHQNSDPQQQINTEQVQQQQPQLQEQTQIQQQQSYEYQQQQYFLYLQQLHQYQQQSGLVQDPKLLPQQVNFPEKQLDQQMLPGIQHKNKELPSQEVDGPSEVDTVQNQGIDDHASTSGATGQLKPQDELPEIE